MHIPNDKSDEVKQKLHETLNNHNNEAGEQASERDRMVGLSDAFIASVATLVTFQHIKNENWPKKFNKEFIELNFLNNFLETIKQDVLANIEIVLDHKRDWDK